MEVIASSGICTCQCRVQRSRGLPRSPTAESWFLSHWHLSFYYLVRTWGSQLQNSQVQATARSLRSEARTTLCFSLLALLVASEFSGLRLARLLFLIYFEVFKWLCVPSKFLKKTVTWIVIFMLFSEFEKLFPLKCVSGSINNKECFCSPASSCWVLALQLATRKTSKQILIRRPLFQNQVIFESRWNQQKKSQYRKLTESFIVIDKI